MDGACAWVCVEVHENCCKLQCFAKFCVLGQVFLSCPLLMWCSSASGLLRGCRGHLHLAGQTASGAVSLVEHYNGAANALFLQHTQRCVLG